MRPDLDYQSLVNTKLDFPVTDETALAAVPRRLRQNGGQTMVLSLNKSAVWRPTSVLPAKAGSVVVPTDISSTDAYGDDPISAPGRWIIEGAEGGAVDSKASVKLILTTNFASTFSASTNTLTASSNGVLSAIDGVTPAVGDRILLAGQTTGLQNGLYYVKDVGSASTPALLTRTVDADTSAKVTPNMTVWVEQGTIYADTQWVLTTDATITLNTTSLTFARATSVQAGPVHTVRGVVTSNVSDLSAFTVAGNDGLTYAAGERVLLAKQTTATEDGIYVVGTVGGGTAPLTRAADWAPGAVLPGGSEVMVNEGTSWKNTKWFASLAGSITVGTSSPAFYPREQRGTSGALSGTPGTITISTGWIRHATESTVILTRRAPGGTPGHLSFGTLTAGRGDGAFTITSTGNETSTIDWIVKN